MGKLTLDEVADLSGVSRSTVSRVINRRTNVSPETREHVEEIIARTGYAPNPAARSLAGSRSSTLALVVPETTEILFTDPYFSHLIQGVADACNQHEYALSLVLLPIGDGRPRLPNRLLQARLFDGVIITATYIDDLLVPYLLHNQIPFVTVGQCHDPRVSYVDADNVGGGYAAVAHLNRIARQADDALDERQRLALDRKDHNVPARRQADVIRHLVHNHTLVVMQARLHTLTIDQRRLDNDLQRQRQQHAQ